MTGSHGGEQPPAARRFLDAEIARVVFGRDPALCQLCPRGFDGGACGHVPRYSERIEAAWLVVDQARAWGFFLGGVCEDVFDDGAWTVTFNGAINEDGDDRDFEGHGATAQEALCRAGLAVARWWNDAARAPSTGQDQL